MCSVQDLALTALFSWDADPQVDQAVGNSRGPSSGEPAVS